MIYINLFDNPPPQKLIDEGKLLTQQLLKLPPNDRTKFIDDNKDYWGKLKDFYKDLSHGKCWYTEVRDIASHYHMDHFRPKNKVIKLEKNCPYVTTNSSGAYWWLAFDWENYRFSASIPNTSKSSYFPLQEETCAASKKDDLDKEWPALLDPTDEYDVSLIAFGIDGKVYPACIDATCWDAVRVAISVRVYDLNNVSLVDARKEIQQTCKVKIKLIKDAQREYAKTHSPGYRSLLKQYVLELKEMTKATSELSAVARNYIRNDSEEFIRNIAG